MTGSQLEGLEKSSAGESMRVHSLRIALQAAALALIFLSTAGASDFGKTFRHPKQSLQGKITYCTGCHGHSGQGYRGYYAMPRLAGQTSTYLENQLQAFGEHRRESQTTLKIEKVHGLGPAILTALAGHFEDLDTKPLGGGPRQLVDQGRKIYEEGLPDANVPACSACHGPEAMGDGANPRLAGQLYPYTVKALTNWSKERTQNARPEDTALVMAPIAQNLTRQQIEAVAAYLSYLK
jgi:cytochrome c553